MVTSTQFLQVCMYLSTAFKAVYDSAGRQLVRCVLLCVELETETCCVSEDGPQQFCTVKVVVCC